MDGYRLRGAFDRHPHRPARFEHAQRLPHECVQHVAIAGLVRTNFFSDTLRDAQITMQAEQPWSFELRDNTRSTLAVQCQRAASTSTVEDDWTGSIFLPPTRRSSQRKFFHAKLSGPYNWRLSRRLPPNSSYSLRPSSRPSNCSSTRNSPQPNGESVLTRPTPDQRRSSIHSK